MEKSLASAGGARVDNRSGNLLQNITPWLIVGGQEHSPIESRYLSGFFVLSVQVLVPSQGQELVPIAD
ncbi:MAG: hypothetical protein ACQEXX_16245 [Bacillota bacterium]